MPLFTFLFDLKYDGTFLFQETWKELFFHIWMNSSTENFVNKSLVFSFVFYLHYRDLNEVEEIFEEAWLSQGLLHKDN